MKNFHITIRKCFLKTLNKLSWHHCLIICRGVKISFCLFFLISILEGRSLLATITTVIKLNFCHYSSILHGNLIALIKTSEYTGSVGDGTASKIKTITVVLHGVSALLGLPELWRQELLTVAAHNKFICWWDNWNAKWRGRGKGRERSKDTKWSRISGHFYCHC